MKNKQFSTFAAVSNILLDVRISTRGNLSSIQKIAIAEKYRSIYEKQAKENLINAGKLFGKGKKPLVKLPNPIASVNTAEKLASVANVSEKTYRMGAKILNSNNEKLKQEVLSGEKSINAGYKLKVYGILRI